MIIVFDFDETLVFNSYNPRSALEVFSVSYGGGLTETFILRPYTRRVLSAVRRICKGLFLGTCSTRARTNRLLEVLGLEKHFDRVFTRENFDPVFRGSGDATSFPLDDFLMVDDRDTSSPLIQAKMKFFGVEGSQDQLVKHLVSVPKFDGSDGDRALLLALDDIQSRLAHGHVS